MARSIIYSTPPIASRSLNSPSCIIDVVAAKDRTKAGILALRYRRLYNYDDIYRSDRINNVTTIRYHLGET